MSWLEDSLDSIEGFFIGPEENEPEAEDEHDGFFGVREPR